MNAWFRRLLLILTIGGGFAGVLLTIHSLPQGNKVIGYISLLAFIGLYSYGIFVGFKLSEGPVPLEHLRVYFGLQIPFISSPLIAYRFCSGLSATVAIIQPGLRGGLGLPLGQCVAVCNTLVSAVGRWHQFGCVSNSASLVFSLGGVPEEALVQNLTKRCSQRLHCAKLSMSILGWRAFTCCR